MIYIFALLCIVSLFDFFGLVYIIISQPLVLIYLIPLGIIIYLFTIGYIAEAILALIGIITIVAVLSRHEIDRFIKYIKWEIRYHKERKIEREKERLESIEKEKRDKELAEKRRIEQEEREIYEREHPYLLRVDKIKDVYKESIKFLPLNYNSSKDDLKRYLQFANNLYDKNLNEIHILSLNYILSALHSENDYIHNYRNNDLLKQGYPSFRKRVQCDPIFNYTYKISNSLTSSYIYSKDNFSNNSDLAYSCLSMDSSNEIIEELSKFKNTMKYFDAVVDNYITYLYGLARSIESKHVPTSNGLKETFESICEDVEYLVKYHYTFIIPILMDYIGKMNYCYKISEPVLNTVYAKATKDHYITIHQILVDIGINP